VAIWVTYYNEKYFTWQKNSGELSIILGDCYKFKKFIKPSDNVVDFGCGGGFMLKSLNCRNKLGVEINDTARSFASTQGIKTVKDADEIKEEWADVIISDNALEHTTSPYDQLQKLYPKLKVGGKTIFVVPHEKKMPWKPNDINQHLFTWSPLCIGNLFEKVGFKVDAIDYLPIWPPAAKQIRKFLGFTGFIVASKVYTRFWGHWSQIRIVAIKPGINRADY
jgi:hypothetical protein